MNLSRSRPLVKELLAAGELLEVEGETVSGTQTLVLHRARQNYLTTTATMEHEGKSNGNRAKISQSL